MISDRFPYDLPSFEALVRLVQETKPQWNVRAGFVKFGDLYASPTPELPGRTFIEMEDLYNQTKYWFVYRRLNFALVSSLPKAKITIHGKATPKSIAEEINRSRKMFLGPQDVDFSNEDVAHGRTTFTYTLKALPLSYVYYGQTDLTIEVIANTTVENARLLEDGSYRLLEDGTIRVLES